MELRDYKSAYRLLVEADLFAPSDSRYLLMRAELAASFSQREQALSDLAVLRKGKSDEVGLATIELKLHLSLRDYDAARAFLKGAPRAFLTAKESSSLLLRFYYEVGRYQKVIDWWQKNPGLKGVTDKGPIIDLVSLSLIHI